MVSIDTVYQKVLALANKEQRGYITPQEFNLFADQAQKEIFEQYFYDLNQFSRGNTSSAEYADIVSFLNEKINAHKTVDTYQVSGGSGQININLNCYRLGTIWDPNGTIVEEIDRDKLLYIQKSNLMKPSNTYPVYTRALNTVTIYPTREETGVYRYEYIKQPGYTHPPMWTYVVVNGKAMYDPNNGSLQDFDLHYSEESELVYKILKFAGISMKKTDITQAAQGMEAVNIQQQKQ